MEARAGEAAVLHVGGGGFSFPRYLTALDPTVRHTIRELDPEVLATAREALGYVPPATTRIELGDARRSIVGLADGEFDLVVGDAFGGLAVPWHLTTVEFGAEVRGVMAPGGRYILNLIDGPALNFVRAEARTLAARFEYVAVVAGRAILGGGFSNLANVVLVASDEPIDAQEIAARMLARGDGGGNTVISGAGLAAFIGGAPLLTDDFAPVDQLIGR
jgi:spermidine synthase